MCCQRGLSDKKVSITVDEWTDICVRRFINITLYSSTTKFVLGLVKINGSCSSEIVEDLIKNRLLEYGVDLKNGANVMVKYSKLVGIVSQLCNNHAIHLVVVKTMYNNIITETEEVLEEDDDCLINIADDDDESDINTKFF